MYTDLRSMTGYGQAHFEDNRLRISVEVKSINSKHADVSLKIPRAFSAQEVAWRNLVTAHLVRGKVMLTITYEHKLAASPVTYIDQELFKTYYDTLNKMAQEVGATSQEIFRLALQCPEVITKPEQDIDPEVDEKILATVLKDALRQCDQSRQIEGAALAKKLSLYLENIKKCLAAVEKLAPTRKKAIREKLKANVVSLAATPPIDEERLEQELLYYVERLDITEEVVRLTQHLAYFEEVMESTQSEGKKLGFIAQEMGREINTIGAKANDAAIQKEVILMKEELEKIREQVQNIL